MTEYNYYGYLKLTLNSGGHKGYTHYFENEYTRIQKFRGSTNPASQITVNIVADLPTQKSGDIIKSAKFKQLFTYSYLIRNYGSEHIEVFFKRHWIDRVYMNAIGVYLQAQIIEPLMYYQFLKQNIVFLHAAGVMKNNCGYLFPAYGGTGKTTFSMALLNNGFKLLGDDLLFVNTNDKTVSPYPRPMHLFTYNINHLIGAHVPLKYKLAIYAKNGLRFLLERILKTEFLISTRVHADEVFSNDPFGDTAEYKKIMFLTKSGPIYKKSRITLKNYKVIAEKIINSADLNDSLYELLPAHELTKAKVLEIEVVSSLLMDFESISYINTRKLDLNNLGSFIAEHLNGK